MSVTKRIAMPALVLLGILTAMVPSADPVRACGIAPPRGYEATVADETALIVYDSATKTQHFLRLAKFETTSADFGFFVPTPSQPELSEASAAIFPMLTKLTEPVVVQRTVTQVTSISCGGVEKSSMKSGHSEYAMPVGVRVVEKKRIGAFDAAVLKAESVKSLQDWLQVNEYSSRPTLEAWFGEYVRLGWYITAFKVAGGESTASVNSPVRLSFKTDVPIYPYREPLNQHQPVSSRHQSRVFRLFVLSDARVEGKLGRGENASAFVGKTVWSKPVEASAIDPALTAGNFPPIAGKWHLTEFEDSSAPRRGTDDLYFSKAKSQNYVERPPFEIVTVEIIYWPIGLCFTVCGLFVILLFYGSIRLGRRILRKRGHR